MGFRKILHEDRDLHVPHDVDHDSPAHRSEAEHSGFPDRRRVEALPHHAPGFVRHGLEKECVYAALRLRGEDGPDEIFFSTSNPSLEAP